MIHTLNAEGLFAVALRTKRHPTMFEMIQNQKKITIQKLKRLSKAYGGYIHEINSIKCSG